jgi:transcriptional regulator with XRE-family HTH domain
VSEVATRGSGALANRSPAAVESAAAPIFGFTPSERLTYELTLLSLLAATQIERLLTDAGLEDQDLAQRLGKSKSWVSKILSGAQNLTLGTLAEVGVALGVRWELEPSSMHRAGLPAAGDPIHLPWVRRQPRQFWQSQIFNAESMVSTGEWAPYTLTIAPGVFTGMTFTFYPAPEPAPWAALSEPVDLIAIGI